jgi:hypothetical protein
LTATTSSPAKPARLSLRDLELTPNRLLVGALLIAAGLSLLSLAFNHAIDYDPEGWIVYGRELFGMGALNTRGFPAWKPLPAILIGPFTLITRGEGDVYYWLFIARAASVLTVFAAANLAYRFGGRVAALLAAFLVVISPWWAVDGAIGRDSSLSAALFMGAFLAHYRGWYRWAVLALAGVALLRPEAGPFLIVYGLWMWRSRRLAWWFSSGILVVVVLLWLYPTLTNSGLSPAAISRNSGGPDAAVNTSFPFGTVILDAAKQTRQLPAVLLVIAIITSLFALYCRVRRRLAPVAVLWGRSGEELALLGAAVGWVLIVAGETQKGYAGNPRYLIPGVAIFFAAGAVVAVRLARWAATTNIRFDRIEDDGAVAPGRPIRLARSTRNATLAVVAVCVIGTAAASVHSLRSGVQLIQQRDHQVYEIRRELAVVSCHHGIYANNANNAYLAQLTGLPLNQTVNWHLPFVFFKDTGYWFVYCKPA